MREQEQQLELWRSEEGEHLRIPPIYQEMPPDQRRQIIGRLARLILKQVRNNTSTDIKNNHER